jgi:hypothetical protein
MSFVKNLEKVCKKFVDGCELIVVEPVSISVSPVSDITLLFGSRAILKTTLDKTNNSIISVFISQNVTQELVISNSILKNNFNRYYDV